MVCVTFSLSSIYKYWISANEDTSRKGRWRKCANVRYLKPDVFIVLSLIQNQNLKNYAHYYWDTYHKNVATRFNKVICWAVWIGDPRNFHNSFFVKNYYLKLIFFQVPQSALWWPIAFILTSIINVI